MDGRKRFGRIAFSLAIAMLLGLAPAASLAQYRGGPPEPPDPERTLDRMAERLDLDDQQREDLSAIFTAHRREMRSTHEAIRAAREALNTQIEAEDFDERAIRKAASVLTALDADRAVGRAKLFQEIRGILTPEQYQEFQQMREDRRGRMGPGRRGPFSGPNSGSPRRGF